MSLLNSNNPKIISVINLQYLDSSLFQFKINVVGV